MLVTCCEFKYWFEEKSDTSGSLHLTLPGTPQAHAEHMAGGALSPDPPANTMLVCDGHGGSAPAPS